MIPNPTRAVLRLLALLVLAGGSFSLAPAGVAVLGLLLLGWAGIRNPRLPALWWRRVMMLKWFFLAIFVLYLFGGLQVDGRPDWEQAAYRVGVLVLLVGIVAVSLDGLPAQELAQGLGKLLSPLSRLGFAVDSFSRRLALTLDAVAHMQSQVRALDRSGGLAAVASVFEAAEDYQASTPSAAPVAVPVAADRAYLVTALAAIVALQWL